MSIVNELKPFNWA